MRLESKIRNKTLHIKIASVNFLTVYALKLFLISEAVSHSRFGFKGTFWLDRAFCGFTVRVTSLSVRVQVQGIQL